MAYLRRKRRRTSRAYEVALNGIRQVSDTVDKLQDLNKKLKDLKELPKTADTKIQNALFVGSTELQKMLKKNENTEKQSHQRKTQRYSR